MTDPRVVLHVDMDAFYAAIEQRDRPELRGRPVIVGADPRDGHGRGVVATASYEARRFGVASAQPISQAWRRCPHGVYLRPDFEKYSAASRQVMDVLRRFTDCVEPVSIDEAFLDVTGSRRAFGDGETVARRLKDDIRAETGLTASVGVASSKLVAKVASDMRKPDGLVLVPPGTEADFLAPLPVRRLWGVGPKMEEALARLGIATIGDLARVDPGRLERRLGTHGHDLVLLARGVDDRPVVGTHEEAKSVGHEHTFDRDTADGVVLRRTLLELCDSVARRLRASGLRGRTVTLKYRDETFSTVTRAETLEAATDAGDVLFATAGRLFDKAHGARRVRLLGVYASGFTGGRQQALFAREPSRSDRVRDAVSARFGNEAITRASLLAPPARPSAEPPPGPQADPALGARHTRSRGRGCRRSMRGSARPTARGESFTDTGGRSRYQPICPTLIRTRAPEPPGDGSTKMKQWSRSPGSSSDTACSTSRSTWSARSGSRSRNSLRRKATCATVPHDVRP